MGSGDWFKTIISRKKQKGDSKSKKSKWTTQQKSNGSNSKDYTFGDTSGPREDKAATRIQTAFRAYKARKVLRRMKGTVRLQGRTKGDAAKKQSTSVLTHLHTWSRIQAEIKERRLCMVAEERVKQKKIENQLKLEAKIHDFEVEWSSGAETVEEVLARIHHREEASVKRERALAYAFSHQWRANSNQNQGGNASALGGASWGWSWKERWVAARPWENRVLSQRNSPANSKKANSKPMKVGPPSKNATPVSSQKSLPPKTASVNGKDPTKPRRLSYPGATAPNGVANKGRSETSMKSEAAT